MSKEVSLLLVSESLLNPRKSKFLFSAPKVARDIKWTKNLTTVFIDNFKLFPDLSWQYFGSAEGIHRQYPGVHYLPYKQLLFI